MKAIVIEEFGGSEQLKHVEVPKPEPKDNEVQIQVAYAGVNPVDWKICEGYLKDWMPHRFPLILGWDAAGTVSAVGKNVTHLNVGDEVYTYCRKPIVQEGAYAEFLCFDAEHVVRKPKNISLAQASGVPLVALTAWQALFDFANLKKGDTVLVHAGAGGVGGFGIQFAKSVGATVLTTCSEKNIDYVKQLGADSAIDYTKFDFVEVVKEQFPKGIDIVFDCVGGETLKKSFDVIRDNGCLVTVVNKDVEEFESPRGIRTGFVLVTANGKDLQGIAELIEKGQVVPLKTEELSLDAAIEAHERSRKRHICGKVVLKVRG